MSHSRFPTLALSALLALGAIAPPAAARSKGGDDDGGEAKKQTLVLDGELERINWNDGDSFRIVKGKREGQKARLVGYNTPESYGPVHFWGEFNGWDIYHVHKAATDLAKSEPWECTSDGKADGYGRILVTCPELRKRLVREGLAHVYAYKDEPDPELIALQLEAQNERRGMWAKGIPRGIVTSVHSMDEKEDDDDGKGPRTASYNRVCDTRTGKTYTLEHTAIYKPCDVFCYAGSCLVYVPFDSRYGAKKPECVKGDAGEQNRMDARPHLHQPFIPKD